MRRAIRNGRAETLPRLIENASEALERLTRLSADLVEVSRGTPPQLTLTPLDLAAVVAQACDWAKAAAAEKGVTLIRDTSLANLWIEGDEQALLTVCGNLLTNGIRYTPAGGTVTVRLGEDDQGAWLEVQDTGIGMTPETQARVFEHFFRAPEAQTMVAQGMGVGLTLTQRLVAAHHGTVSVASAVGQGSTFRVTLPR
jgi:signal transduction histidine kinase